MRKSGRSSAFTLTKRIMSKVVVVGAGAAGMMAALSAAKAGHRVTIFEKNEKAGKKLFITGKGRCNVTNDSDVENILSHVAVNKKFLYSALYGFSSQDVMQLFEDAGLHLKVERGNRVFPASDKSSDVIRTLVTMLEKLHVRFVFNAPVRAILTEQDEEGFTKARGVLLESDAACKEKEVPADAVIVATGGISYPSTGSTGDGYRFARATGHTLTEPKPSLVPFNIAQDWVKGLQGLSLKNVTLSVWHGKKKIYEDFGEMLFTHFGISGPLVLSASPVCLKYIEEKSLKAVIDLKPALSEEQLDARLLKDFEKYHNKQFHNALSDLLPVRLIDVVVDLSRIDPYKKVNEITRQERMTLLHLLKHMEMDITGTRGFNEAIITRGGVSVRDIDASTMASKRCRHLYFAGEVIDVDALTGGYNLQIAWSTGWLAGLSIAEV